jgi:sterol desaturase/sphingolipid hydroxylase (fatty acid hydroxylase superfamily)
VTAAPKPVCPPGPSRRILWVFPALIAGLIGWNVWSPATPAWRWVSDPLVGLVAWTLVEYVAHRWLFHIVPASAWLRDRQQHLAHHAAPMDPDYYVIPLWLSLPVAGVVWSGLRLAAGSWRSAGLMLAGAMIGYVAYELVHHAIHLGRGGGRLLRFWRRHHLYHHYRDEERCFGFTTSLWDVVFGTARPRHSPAEPPGAESRLAG